jgi:hypothetical protein
MKTLKLLVLVCAFGIWMIQPLKAFSSSLCDAIPGNLVTNCGFEAVYFTGWTKGGNEGMTGIMPSGYYKSNSGNWFLEMGPKGSDGTLSQTLTTITGQDYAFAFYLASEGDSPSDFSAYWDGTQLLSLTNPNSGVAYTSGGAYTLYTYTVTGTGSDTIQFDFRDDPGVLLLDDISVSAVPEPDTFSLLILGLGLGLAFVGRQRLFA